jgi:polyisoprenoid-binding protein YceI
MGYDMLKKLILSTFIALTPLAASAQTVGIAAIPSGDYTLDPTHASLTWKVNHLGLSNYTARFTKFDAKIHFDGTDPTKSTLTATVDPASIKTDYPTPEKEDFDAKLRGAEWLNTTTFPTISYVSTRIEKISDTTGKIHGNLTFLGVTKPITLDAVFVGGMTSHPFTKAPAMGFSASTTLKRSDFGFSTYVPMIGDEVKIQIEAEFFKAP